MDIAQEMLSIAKGVKEASHRMAQATSEEKNKVIFFMIRKLKERQSQIIEANEKDLEKAKSENLSEHLRKRLVFGEKEIESRIQALKKIASLPDPVDDDYGELRRLSNGITWRKLKVPIGVIAMIYEARPHVTVNAGALCSKSGNAVILKGGSETIHSNLCLGNLWQDSLKEAELPREAIQVISTTEHQAVNELLKLDEYIDLIIPRGGKNLIQLVVENSGIPVIKHYQGICHTYVDEEVDLNMAKKVSLNAKLHTPEVCNAMETLLVAQKVAPRFLPSLVEEFRREGVEIRGCPKTRKIVSQVEEASKKDWRTEYLDLILSVRVVKNLKEAIQHINLYGSHHTDAIISNNPENCQRFLREVDSGVILINASTMLNDAQDLGMGAEIGISTDKLHARGPMGLEELTTYKVIIYGEGQIKP